MDKELLSLMALDCLELRNIKNKMEIMRSRHVGYYFQFSEIIRIIDILLEEYETMIEGEIKVE